MIDTRLMKAGLPLAAALLFALPFVPTRVEAQQAGGRFRVLVTNLKPSDGSRANFGEDVANRLRDILDLDRHVAMPNREADQAARQYDMRAGDLNCVSGIQLANIINVQLVFCGEYATEGNNVSGTAAFVTVPAGERFEIPVGPVAANQGRQVAEQVLAFLQETAVRLEQIDYCGQDFRSQNWEGALNYCTRAVELAPESKEARGVLARVYMELQRWPQSLEQFEILLEDDPYNSGLLQSAGYVAAQVGETQKAREYYGQYLELNPSDVQVRIQIANDLATSGDDLGAMRLLEAGFEQAPNNPNLHLQYGAMAFRAAATMETTLPSPPPDPLPAEIVELYRNAVESHSIVLDSLGADMRPTDVVNMFRAYGKTGDYEAAIELGQRILQFFRENPEVIGELAVTYNRAGRIDDALEWMERALELNPNLPNARIRMAQILLGADRIDEAIDWAGRAAQSNEAPPDQIGTVLFAHGWNEEVQKGDRPTGEKLFDAAKAIPGITPALRSQVNFFHGVSLYQPRDAALRTDASLQACQTHTPGLRMALQYLEGGREYGQRANQNVQQFIDATNVWVNDVCAAVIQREQQRTTGG